MQMIQEQVWTRLVLADGRATVPPPDRGRQIVHRMVAGSLGALLVLLLTGYLISARVAEHQALTDSRHLTELVGETLVEPHLTPALLAGRPAAVARLDTVVRDEDGLVFRTFIRRVKVWSDHGTVLYSSSPAEIGRTYAFEDEQRTALTTGKTVATISDLSRAENVADRGLGARMVEVYTPLRSASGHTVLFETYISYGEVKHRRANLFTTFSLVTAGLLAVFALFQVWFVGVNLRWLRRRQGALQAAAEQDAARERRTVARDLHDGVVQDLIGTSLLVEGVRTALEAGEQRRADRLLTQVGQSVRSSVLSLRSTLITVYPPRLAEDGLAMALDDLAQTLRSRGVEVRIDDRIDRPLPASAAEATYRAAQEALRNICRHAHASTVTIELFVAEARLCLVVRDDGVGMTPEELTSLGSAQGHFGLRTIVDAAQEIHGYVEISAAPTGGTEMRWELPL